MARQVSTSDTLTFIPSSFDSTNSTYASVYNNNNPSNGLTDHNSSTRACVYSNTGASAVSDLWYNFDCSEIPSGATIDSVSCIAGASCYSSGSYFSTRTLQLYVGTSTAKGSATTITGNGSTKTNHTLTCGSSWSRSDLDNLKLRVHIVRSTSNTTTSASFSFWGATLTIAYSVNGYMYEITSSSSVTGYTTDPASQEVFQGGSGEVRIDGSTLTGISVKDNNVDVTSQLVQHTASGGGTVSAVLGSYSLTSGGFNGSGASYFSGLVGAGVDHTKTTSNYYSSGNGTIAVFTYNLDFTGIPSNATITRVYCEVNGHAESTSQSSEYMCVQLISGNTNISSELNFKSIGTSNSTQTLEATTIPTLSQLENLQLKCRLGYYGGAINGATCYVEYTVPTSNPYYWTYTISNIAADHTVVIVTSGGSTTKLYAKINGTWTPFTKAYKKINGSWVEQTDLTTVFNTTNNYRRGN